MEAKTSVRGTESGGSSKSKMAELRKDKSLAGRLFLALKQIRSGKEGDCTGI